MSVSKLPRPDTLKEAVIHFEETLVTADQVRNLIRVWPKASPLKDLENEQLGPNEKWDKAEDYMLKLLEPASMHARLKMWRFRVDWGEERAIQEDSVQI